MTPQITPVQRAEFDRFGVVRIPGFFAGSDIAAMAGALWADLRARFGAHPDRPKTWPVGNVAGFQRLVRSGAFEPLAALLGLAGILLGAPARRAGNHWGLPLVTFPTGAWEVPHAVWHFDLPPSELLGPLATLRVFVFLERVEAGGGGTAYVESSHRVVLDRVRAAPPGAELRSADMRALLIAEEPWLAALSRPGGEDRRARLMQAGGEMRGLEVRVREMTGEAGDVMLMHPAMLHTIAGNARRRPRLMLTETFVQA